MKYDLQRIENGWLLHYENNARSGTRIMFFKTVIEATDFINTQEGMAALREAPKDFRKGGAQIDLEEVLGGENGTVVSSD